MESIDLFSLKECANPDEQFILLRCLNENYSIIISEIKENGSFYEFIKDDSQQDENITQKFYQVYSVKFY